jgi:hypothetical protein
MQIFWIQNDEKIYLILLLINHYHFLIKKGDLFLSKNIINFFFLINNLIKFYYFFIYKAILI